MPPRALAVPLASLVARAIVGVHTARRAPPQQQSGPKVIYGNARRWHSGAGAGADAGVGASAGTALERTASLSQEHARKLQMAMHARKQQQQADAERVSMYTNFASPIQ